MKTLRPLFAIFLVVAFFYLAWKLIPPYLANYQFQDAVMAEARNNTYSQKNEGDIRDIVYKRAQDMEIPITPQQIIVHRTGSYVSIQTSYSVHVDLVMHPIDLQFNTSSSDKRAY